MNQPFSSQLKPRVIAVLTEVKENHEQGPRFGSIHRFCEELNQLVTESGDRFFVFSLKGFSRNKIHGYSFDNNQWQKNILPFPDVVYNRIHSRRTEGGDLFKTFRQKAEELNTILFNERFLSKWEVHQWFSQKKNLERYLPETFVFSKTTFTRLYTSYDNLFLKPVTGSQGRGILWVRKTEDGHNEVLAMNNQKLEQHQIATSEELSEALIQMVKNRPYLVQQGLPLLQIQDKRLDFRILCHHKAKQGWEVTSLVARLSADHHFAANMALGGEILRPLHVLSYFFGKEKAASLIEMIKELALESAACITENVSGFMVELGIDIGVDQSGDLWVIEVNSKPSKNFENNAGKIRPSARALVECCTHYLNACSEGESK